jgi:high-affinity iron transporter
MLMWHNAWMARHGREMTAELTKVGAEVSEGSRPLTALAMVVGLAVLREGSEIVLFLYGIVAGGTSGSELLLGGVLGLATGAAFTGLTYVGLLAIPSKYIFKVTTVLITLLAAGMAAQAVRFLDQAGLVTALGQILWDTSPWLPEDGVLGKLLHTIIGYNEQPTAMQLIAYVGVLVAMALLMRIAAPARSLAVRAAS